MTPATTHRQRQALATRAAVTAAARALFAENGYVGTTMDSIAASADIPVQTIYSAFGTKAAILEDIRVTWIAASRVADLHSRALAASQPKQRLAGAAEWTRRQFEMGYDIVSVHQEAARADPRVAASWRHALAGRESAIKELIASVAPALKAQLSTTRAVGLYVALTLPEIYRELVISRGWKSSHYESWLAEALQTSLLRRA